MISSKKSEQKIASSVDIAGEQRDGLRSTGIQLSSEANGPFFKTVYQALSKAFKAYCGLFSELSEQNASFEAFGVYRYQDSTERYVWHADGADPGLRYRFASMVLYLNSVEEGGETGFKYFSQKISPEEGALLVFPAGWTSIHQARPPISGPKYVLITWICVIHRHPFIIMWCHEQRNSAAIKVGGPL
ncbi:2OG-Fe(II) oxygenase [Gammaproteobacteria bacterium]|nr:2OG-Fe(II) oxygenase [Gammaproteobacteria bacterium]